MGGIFPSIHLCPASSTGSLGALRETQPHYQPSATKMGNQATTAICGSLKRGTVGCPTEPLLFKLIFAELSS